MDNDSSHKGIEPDHPASLMEEAEEEGCLLAQEFSSVSIGKHNDECAEVEPESQILQTVDEQETEVTISEENDGDSTSAVQPDVNIAALEDQQLDVEYVQERQMNVLDQGAQLQASSVKTDTEYEGRQRQGESQPEQEDMGAAEDIAGNLVSDMDLGQRVRCREWAMEDMVDGGDDSISQEVVAVAYDGLDHAETDAAQEYCIEVKAGMEGVVSSPVLVPKKEICSEESGSECSKDDSNAHDAEIRTSHQTQEVKLQPPLTIIEHLRRTSPAKPKRSISLDEGNSTDTVMTATEGVIQHPEANDATVQTSESLGDQGNASKVASEMDQVSTDVPDATENSSKELVTDLAEAAYGVETELVVKVNQTGTQSLDQELSKKLRRRRAEKKMAKPRKDGKAKLEVAREKLEKMKDDVSSLRRALSDYATSVVRMNGLATIVSDETLKFTLNKRKAVPAVVDMFNTALDELNMFCIDVFHNKFHDHVISVCDDWVENAEIILREIDRTTAQKEMLDLCRTQVDKLLFEKAEYIALHQSGKPWSQQKEEALAKAKEVMLTQSELYEGLNRDSKAHARQLIRAREQHFNRVFSSLLSYQRKFFQVANQHHEDFTHKIQDLRLAVPQERAEPQVSFQYYGNQASTPRNGSETPEWKIDSSALVHPSIPILRRKSMGFGSIDETSHLAIAEACKQLAEAEDQNQELKNKIATLEKEAEQNPALVALQEQLERLKQELKDAENTRDLAKPQPAPAAPPLAAPMATNIPPPTTCPWNASSTGSSWAARAPRAARTPWAAGSSRPTWNGGKSLPRIGSRGHCQTT